VPSATTEHEPRFFLHVERAERVLWCLLCGNRTPIEDRPWAMVEAEAAHDCGLTCRCWCQGAHEATSGSDCPDG
jgi:hypothetical protein